MERYFEYQERLDSRTGLICAVIANAHRSKGKVFKPKDFMPNMRSQRGKLPTLEEIRLMNIAAGGDDICPKRESKEPSQEELKLIVENIKRDAGHGK